MAMLPDFVKEASEVWPVIGFIGAVIYGYARLVSQVDRLKEKIKDADDKDKAEKEEIDGDIKGVSLKTNGFMKEVNDELKEVRKENSLNHLKVSNDIHELKGMILVLSAEKK